MSENTERPNITEEKHCNNDDWPLTFSDAMKKYYGDDTIDIEEKRSKILKWLIRGVDELSKGVEQLKRDNDDLHQKMTEALRN